LSTSMIDDKGIPSSDIGTALFRDEEDIHRLPLGVAGTTRPVALRVGMWRIASPRARRN
jgi:hypothetical protein